MAELRLQQQFIETCITMHYAYKTQKSYWYWIRRFILFHDIRHPDTLHEQDVARFLTYLAVDQHVAPSTQSNALNSINFLYKNVLHKPLGVIPNFRYAVPKKRLPMVLRREEVSAILAVMPPKFRFMAALMYASGMRVSECIRLRIKDLDIDKLALIIIDGKGNIDRQTVFSPDLVEALEKRIEQRELLHQLDLSAGQGSVYLPYALKKKYPKFVTSFQWQFLFASSNYSKDPRNNDWHRHHIVDRCLQRAITQAGVHARLKKHITSHVLRHSFATHMLEDGKGIHQVQKLLGHKDPKTTMIYLHVMERNGHAISSPLKYYTDD